MLQKYNVEEDLIDPAPPQLSPHVSLSLSPYFLDTTRKLELELDEQELELDEVEGPLILY